MHMYTYILKMTLTEDTTSHTCTKTLSEDITHIHTHLLKTQSTHTLTEDTTIEKKITSPQLKDSKMKSGMRYLFPETSFLFL